MTACFTQTTRDVLWNDAIVKYIVAKKICPISKRQSQRAAEHMENKTETTIMPEIVDKAGIDMDFSDNTEKARGDFVRVTAECWKIT